MKQKGQNPSGYKLKEGNSDKRRKKKKKQI
jgi:hypothetical protein